MDENSAIKGFKAVFGIDNEEIAVRFYRLFVLPVNKHVKMDKISLLRFYYVVTLMCNLTHESRLYINLGFDFYDFDKNGNIGSVDIINLYKFLP